MSTLLENATQLADQALLVIFVKFKACGRIVHTELLTHILAYILIDIYVT